jgi:quinol monooxygenase YgiN
MICVVAAIETLPGRRDELLATFHALVPTVRAEKGCIEYAPMTDAANPMTTIRENTVTVVEKWESLAALNAHLQTPHMVGFFEQTKPLQAGMTLQILQPA